MSNIEEICDEIVILDNGKLVLSGNLHDIKNKYPKKHIKITGGNISEIKEALQKSTGNIIDGIEADEISLDIHLKNESDRSKILDIVSGKDYEIDSFSVVKPTLNEIFISVSKEVAQ